jgi:hypothetical protein
VSPYAVCHARPWKEGWREGGKEEQDRGPVVVMSTGNSLAA